MGYGGGGIALNIPLDPAVKRDEAAQTVPLASGYISGRVKNLVSVLVVES